MYVQSETAFGGETAGAGNAWWFAFDTQGDATQDIIAGQNEVIGTVTFNEATNTFTINLTDGWRLVEGEEESVKIQGYNALPAERPAAGHFSFKGDDLVADLPDSPDYRYYVIHLDVELCESVN